MYVKELFFISYIKSIHILSLMFHQDTPALGFFNPVCVYHSMYDIICDHYMQVNKTMQLQQDSPGKSAHS